MKLYPYAELVQNLQSKTRNLKLKKRNLVFSHNINLLKCFKISAGYKLSCSGWHTEQLEKLMHEHRKECTYYIIETKLFQ